MRNGLIVGLTCLCFIGLLAPLFSQEITGLKPGLYIVGGEEETLREKFIRRSSQPGRIIREGKKVILTGVWEGKDMENANPSRSLTSAPLKNERYAPPELDVESEIWTLISMVKGKNSALIGLLEKDPSKRQLLDDFFKKKVGISLFFASCEFQNCDLAENLITKFGANVNETSEEGLPVAHPVVLNGDMRTLHMLEKYGVNLEAKSDGRSFLHIAVGKSNSEMVNHLIKSKLNINARDSAGLTPLHYAAILKNMETFSLLLAKGAKRDARDNLGNTPQYYVENIEEGKKEEGKKILELINKDRHLERLYNLQY